MEQQKIFPFVECEQYVSLLQDTINRMATNSSNCKNWLITLIVGLCALQAAASTIHQFIWIAYIPILLLYFLDCFYLGIERRMRFVEKDFVEKAISGKASKEDLYLFKLPEEHQNYQSKFCATVNSMLSFSTTPFYLLITIIVIIIQISGIL